jgi:hypothetical protein
MGETKSKKVRQLVVLLGVMDKGNALKLASVVFVIQLIKRQYKPTITWWPGFKCGYTWMNGVKS